MIEPRSLVGAEVSSPLPTRKQAPSGRVIRSAGHRIIPPHSPANVDTCTRHSRVRGSLRLLAVAALGVSVGTLVSTTGYVDRMFGRDASHNLFSALTKNLTTAMETHGNTVTPVSSRQVRVQQALKRVINHPISGVEKKMTVEPIIPKVQAVQLAHYHVDTPRKAPVMAVRSKAMSAPPIQKTVEVRPVVHSSRALIGRVHSVIKKYAPKHKSPSSLAHAIVQESLRQGVDPLFVAAVVKSESTFNSSARSHKGAQGLMQIMPATGAWLSQKQELPRGKLTDPGYNLRLGISYLKYLEDTYGGNRVFALVAYNWGPGHVNSAAVGKRKIPKECMQYALKIIHDYKRWSSGVI